MAKSSKASFKVLHEKFNPQNGFNNSSTIGFEKIFKQFLTCELVSTIFGYMKSRSQFKQAKDGFCHWLMRMFGKHHEANFFEPNKKFMEKLSSN